MKVQRGWRARFWPKTNKRRLSISAAPGEPVEGLILVTERGQGLRTHAVLVFPLDDLWTFSFGVRAACFTSGGPWLIGAGRPTCLRCLRMLPHRETQLKKR